MNRNAENCRTSAMAVLGQIFLDTSFLLWSFKEILLTPLMLNYHFFSNKTLVELLFSLTIPFWSLIHADQSNASTAGTLSTITLIG